MSNPTVGNLKPAESDGFTPTDTLSFSVRDGDSTRVDRSTVRSIATFSKTAYVPDRLPTSWTQNEYLDVFDDALPDSRPDSPVDRFIQEVDYDSDSDGIDDSTYGPVLFLEKAVSDEEMGVLFVEADVSEPTPVGCEIRVGIKDYTRMGGSPPSYFADADYVGVVAGFVYWPLNTGVFIFFKDDGLGNPDSRSVVVAGPAQDGSGTRLVSTETTIDWLRDEGPAPYSFRVVLDPTSRANYVWVVATNEDDLTEQLLFESSISDLGNLQAAARIGNQFSENPPSKIAGLVGVAEGVAGNYIEVEYLRVDEFGTYLVDQGGPVPNATYQRRTSDHLRLDSYADSLTWNTKEVESLIGETDNTFYIQRSPTAGNAGMYFEEGDLVSRKFVLLFKGSVRLQDHSGSQSTGIGIDVDDGTSLIALRFLDDFASKRIGVLTGTNRDNTGSFAYVDSVWDATTPEILVFADEAQDILQAFVAESGSAQEEVEAAISTTYPTSSSYYATPTTALGFLDAGVTELLYGGRSVVSKFFLLPNCDFFLPQAALAAVASGTAATASPTEVTAPWVQWSLETLGTSSIAEVASVADPRWSITPGSAVDSEFVYLTIPDTEYLPGESGITLFADLRIDSWIDQFEITSTVRIPTAAIMAIDLGDGLFLQIQALLSATGEFYLFVSQDSQDYLEVLNQTELGQKISTPLAQVDSDGDPISRYIMVAYRPGEGIQVYLDLDTEPSISLAWSDKSAVEKASDYLTSGTHSVAVGSIPVSASGESISLSIGAIGCSVGSGFDFVSSLSVSDEALEDSIYGSNASVFIDVSDED